MLCCWTDHDENETAVWVAVWYRCVSLVELCHEIYSKFKLRELPPDWVKHKITALNMKRAFWPYTFLMILASPVTLTQIAKVIWEGDVHITRVLGMGMPKTRGCPYHCDTGLLPQKGKRDLNGEQSCTVTVIKEVYSSKCCPATFHLSMWLPWNLSLSRCNYLKHINNFCTTVLLES